MNPPLPQNPPRKDRFNSTLSGAALVEFERLLAEGGESKEGLASRLLTSCLTDKISTSSRPEPKSAVLIEPDRRKPWSWPVNLFIAVIAFAIGLGFGLRLFGSATSSSSRSSYSDVNIADQEKRLKLHEELLIELDARLRAIEPRKP